MSGRSGSMDGPAKSLWPANSLWKDPKRQTWSFYCPQCRAARTIPCHPRPGTPKHFAQIALTAAFFMLLTWPWFTWKGIVSFVPFWLIFETIYRARVRVVVACPHCGFDPFLYLNDVKRARAEMETHWRKIFAAKGIPYPGAQAGAPEDGASPAAEGEPADGATSATGAPTPPRPRRG